MSRNPANPNPSTDSPDFLKRELGIPAAVMMGLGSMVGTGVFVSIGIAAGIAGPAVVLAIVLAALLAACNALSSAQLAANHPVAGGTYEYGHRWLNGYFGFTAGWMFLLAKSASAATAALGFTGYLFLALGIDSDSLRVPVSIALILGLSGIVMAGIRNSSRANIVFVSVALTALLLFVLIAAPKIAAENFSPFFNSATAENASPLSMLLHATALMFVAYTGYGRIATLGEEVHEPRKTIPRAIVWTLLITALLYIAVGVAGIGSAGASAFYSATEGKGAPLEAIVRDFGAPKIAWIVAAGAMTAMLGVLLNLLLGLSRMAMSLGRRRDLPAIFARLNTARDTPPWSVAAVAILIAALAATGDLRFTWTFSAFTVLIYYAITNLAAIRLKKEERLYSPFFAWTGLAGCLFLAFWVEWKIWTTGLALIALGLVWKFLCQRARESAS